MENGQESIRQFICSVRADVSTFLGTTTSAQLDAERMSRRYQANAFPGS